MPWDYKNLLYQKVNQNFIKNSRNEASKNSSDSLKTNYFCIEHQLTLNEILKGFQKTAFQIEFDVFS